MAQKALTTEQLARVQQLLMEPGNTIVEIAWKLGASRSTIYRAWRDHEMTRNRRAGDGRRRARARPASSPEGG